MKVWQLKFLKQGYQTKFQNSNFALISNGTPVGLSGRRYCIHLYFIKSDGSNRRAKNKEA